MACKGLVVVRRNWFRPLSLEGGPVGGVHRIPRSPGPGMLGLVADGLLALSQGEAEGEMTPYKGPWPRDRTRGSVKSACSNTLPPIF